MSRKTIRTATLAVCALLVTGLLAFTGGATQHLQDDQQQDPSQDDQDVGQQVPEAQQDDEANITFQDQSSEGDEVEIARAVLPQGGFVVIRDDGGLFEGSMNATDGDDTFGNDTFGNDTFGNDTFGNDTSGNDTFGSGDEPLGTSQYLESGSHDNLSILLNGSQEGEVTLTATLYQDTNGDQTFDAEEDEPYQVDGEDVSAQAEVDFRDQDVGADESPSPTATEEDQDTPAPGVLLLVTALASLALWARRRQ